MKGWRRIFLALAACLLLTAPAWAAETEEDDENVSEVAVIECEPQIWFEEVTEPIETASLLSAPWQESWTCYGDQLTGIAKSIYADMESQFKAGTVSYEQKNDGDFSVIFYYNLPSFTVTGRTEDELKSNVTAQLDAAQQSHQSELMMAAYAFTYDHPEYFWIRTDFLYGGGIDQYKYSGPSDGPYTATISNARLLVGYTVDTRYTEAMRASDTAEINSMVNTILAGCKQLSIVGKLTYFDNWLAENNAYNSNAAALKLENYGPVPWNATGALLPRNSPVCEGYAKAFQLLCHEIDVPCITVNSYNHMWNMVQVDGQWYHMDCTWNDPLGNTGPSTQQYFLISEFSENNSTGIDGSHLISQNLVYPTAASSDYYANGSRWSFVGETISGYTSEYSTGKYWMALYSSQGKLLNMLPCVTMPWGNNQTRILAPEFSTSIVSQAQSGKVFLISDETSWKPVEAAETFVKTN